MPARSFYAFACNNEGRFQRYPALEDFDGQMHAGKSAGLLLYDHPAHLIANALMQARYDASDLHQWIDEAVRHLDVVRRHRRNMTVIERGATKEPRAIAAFNKAFAKTKPPAEFAPAPDQTPSQFALIGRFAIHQHTTAAPLLSELEASSVATDAEGPAFDDTMALLANSLPSISQEQKLLELEQRNSELLERCAKSEIHMQQILDLQTSLKETEAARISGESAAEFINAELKTEIATLSDENARLKASMDGIRNSTSWRLTSPVRAVKNILTR